MNFVAVERRASGLLSEVSVERLRAIARVVFGPRARLDAHRLLGDGRFNTSYRLDCGGEPPVVLRLAPEPTAKLWRHERALLQRQCAVQPLLEAAEPAVSRVLHADFSHALLPRDWAVFEWRPGSTWASTQSALDAASAAALWRQFGAIVRNVHAQRGERFGYPAPWPAHESYGAWFAAVVDDLAADLAEQRIEVTALDRFRALVSEQRWRYDAVHRPRLVHGDLWQHNVLVEPGPHGWRISALLDAEHAFFGEPAAEWIFGFLDIPAAFWQGYGGRRAAASPDADAHWRRRAYQARGALLMMLEGARFGFDAGFAHRQFARFLTALETRAPASRFR